MTSAGRRTPQSFTRHDRGVEIVLVDGQRAQVLELRRIAEAADLQHVGISLEFDDVADGVQERGRRGGHADRADDRDLPGRRASRCRV